MNARKLLLSLAVPLFSGFYSGNCLGDVAFERMPKKIAKTYDNGDLLVMTCKGSRNQICILFAKIDGEKRKFILDFASKGYAPTLDFVRMIGANSRPFAVGVAIAVECDRRDEKVLPEDTPSAVCFVNVSLNGAGEVAWQEFVVVGQLMPRISN